MQTFFIYLIVLLYDKTVLKEIKIKTIYIVLLNC